MTDRELLELAASAAGYINPEMESYETLKVTQVIPENTVIGKVFNREYRFTWNPLTDDGDALRLAVKCHIDLDQYAREIRCVKSRDFDNEADDVWESLEGDPYAATRRAIVRAAAEIGKVKP